MSVLPMYDTGSLSYTEAQVEASICRASFSDFAKCFWETVKGAGTLEWNWHMDVLCMEMQILAERVFKNETRVYDLGVNIPPGTSKSTIISILFPAWVWTRMPGARFLSATHTAKLALDLSSKCRDVIASEKYEAYYPHIDLIKDTEGYFRNSQGGDRNTCTVGGVTPTGFHSHFILLDDPIDPEGVRSDADLDKAERFITNVIPGRKTKKSVSVTILVMQRLHWRDPTYVMEEAARKSGAFQFRKICLPGKLSPKVFPPLEELRQRWPEAYNNEGAFLDPGRLGMLVMQDYLSKGAYFFNPQIMQDPEAPGGNMFEESWWHFERTAPYECIRIRAIDRAATEDGGCYTACVLIAMTLDRSKFFVEDCVHGQWSAVKRNEKILAMAQRDRLKYGPKYEPTIIIEGERGSTGEEAYQYLAAQLAGFRVYEDLPQGSKDSRAEPWANQIKAGNVYIVDGGASVNSGKPTWDVEGYIREHTRFRPDPNVKRFGKYKDQVDASALAFIKLVQGGAVSAEEVVKVFTFVKKKSETQLRIVVTNDEILSKLVIDDNETIMISLQDPLPVGSKKTPLHALSKLQETLLLHFVDLQPSERLDQWDEPLLPYGVLAEDLIFTRDMGKRLWNFLFKKRSPAPGVVVIHGNGRKALSVAIAITDTMRLPRSIIYRPDNPDFVVKEPAENDHVYQLVKNSKQWVNS